MLKGTKVYSVFGNKCPKCQEGDFFITQNPYNLKKFDKMHEACSVCGEKFEKEPGFYQGAMYVNYALSVAAGVGWFIIIYLLYGFDPLIYVISFSIVLLLLLPLMFRIGRLLWINFFVKYDKNWKQFNNTKK
ncbi:MAG: DUF983 domain-containing protein [Bacteroidetes bacterium]|jgi:hypothetical protein|nr:DUF983 domain-containing protein [Bacteroidota bacterium]